MSYNLGRGCCLGVSSDQLWLAKMGPAAMLGPTATMHWHGLPERASAQCQADMALCPWSSMAADPACAYPTTAPLQTAYPTRLSECQLPGSGFEKPTGLAPCYPSEDHLLQGVCGGSQVRPVSLPTTLYQPTSASPFSDAFLRSQQLPAIGVQLKEGTASAGQLPRWLLMCPTVTGYGVLDDSQIHSEGTVCEHEWLRASPSNPTCCLGSNKDPPSLTLGPMAPSLYGDMVTFPAGYDLVDGGMSVGEAGPILCAVTRQADRQTDAEDFSQQSQWTPRAVSVDASPQSNAEHGEIRCGRLAHLKVKAEENCSPEYNQVETESELEVAAQALIQLSEAQWRYVRGQAYTR
ncbi:uncharacterized protein LOC122562859 isoform X2 [Chiloscyllium plagiosum]|uniref:uncharacterized protein LOC122562859 isoform X2 n=1 Tax=Chiloscyllium plagiosum TaxID=36176 RepID=UPI001CB7C8F4|nr:uncharacterized protein LOC122562859 isoform X2 [Chiloscyllium plagiosum]